MRQITVRKARETDIPALNTLLYQVHKVHSDVRPDLFKAGGKKYTDAQLRVILKNDETPVFVAESDSGVVGYAFCVHQQFENDHMTDIKTLYIDDLCVHESARGQHIGTQLYKYVLRYAKQNSYYNVTLNVWADNIKAVRFYESLGLKIQKIGMEKIL